MSGEIWYEDDIQLCLHKLKDLHVCLFPLRIGQAVYSISTLLSLLHTAWGLRWKKILPKSNFRNMGATFDKAFTFPLWFSCFRPSLTYIKKYACRHSLCIFVFTHLATLFVSPRIDRILQSVLTRSYILLIIHCCQVFSLISTIRTCLQMNFDLITLLTMRSLWFQLQTHSCGWGNLLIHLIWLFYL